MKYASMVFMLALYSCSSMVTSEKDSPLFPILIIDDYKNEKSRAGYIDRDGRVAIPMRYSMTFPFYNGFARVIQDKKYGFIDEQGAMVGKPGFDDAHDFSEGLAAVKIGDKWGYVGIDGRMVIDAIFDIAESFSEGLAVARKNYRDVVIDMNGKLVFGFDEIVVEPVPGQDEKPGRISTYSSYQCGLLLVGYEYHSQYALAVMYGYIDKSGKMAIRIQYKNAHSFNRDLAVVELSSEENRDIVQEVIIDKTGNMVARLPKGLSSIRGDDELMGMYRGKKNIGFVDMAGRIAIDLESDFAGSFSEGLAAINQDNRWFYIDRTGKEVITLDIPNNGYADQFSEGLAVIENGSKNGFIDKTGKTIVSPRMDSIGRFINGLAVFKNEGVTGYINREGKIVWSTSTIPEIKFSF
jgi:hypothetical protein